MRSLGPLAITAAAVVCLVSDGHARAREILPTEPPITLPGTEGDYLRAMHQRIHFRWAQRFIASLQEGTRPANDPLNKPDLDAEVLFTVRWDGSPAEVTLSKSSGVPAFDRAAVAAVRGDNPYPVPPLELFGDDGVAHFSWRFARDHRLCSDGEVRRREDPLEAALPRLFLQGRIKEALFRVTRTMRAGDASAMSTFARAWLSRRLTDPVSDARAAAALARLGDQQQVARLRPALERADTVAIAAPALAALKIDVCGMVQPALRSREPGAVTVALQALRDPGTALPAGSPCLALVAAMVDDSALPTTLRAVSLEALAVLTPGGARRTVLEALGDRDAHLRAAAARAFARPGGGRPSLYRLQPLLKDPSPDVRAAAAAGLVRASGDLSYEYLQPLLKERELQPLMAMAPELGRQSSAASADFAAKLVKEAAKRNAPDLRAALTAALATRRDPRGRAVFGPLADAVKKDPRASATARLQALAGADADELLPLARDPAVGPLAFKALLRAGRHQEAADWLVASFDRLTPDVLVDLFAAWLSNPPPAVAATARHE